MNLSDTTLGTLEQLAARVGGRVVGDGTLRIARIATVDEAGSDTLTFATSNGYFAAALSSDAGAILVEGELVKDRVHKPLLVVDDVRRALAALLGSFERPRPRGPYRHPSAVVESGAALAGDVYVGASAYVGNGAVIGPGSVVEAGAYIGDGVAIGSAVWIHAGARVLAGTHIGDRVVLHAGCVIGSDGFGWAFADSRAQRIPQVGNVVIEDDVEVGANSCVDRAQTGSTRIGEGTKIDNLVQIGHNCRVGKHCVIAALTGLAGSTVVGDYVKVGGQVGFRGHINVGSRVT
ncbi:MAG: UDP-3-O-(3-hydroxymyristoyl)glucosamine N-acyltransferase, partial [Candidatus Eremiobacteraeota bacterium]|nr:UDP-3-O-(3-hydroxymyristoyl)glucosamine N-acyltransferase [Candidatus Eremiobacteraeota bacterium]